MPTAPGMRELRTMSDDELFDKYDEIAKETQVGLAWFQQEVDRRNRDRHDRLMRVLTVVLSLTAITQAVTALSIWLQWIPFETVPAP